MSTLCDLILKAKSGDRNAMLEIIERFTPIIKKYSYKLNYEDTEQDLILNLIQAVYKMPLLNLDAQAVSYISNSIRHCYIINLRKHILSREHEVCFEHDFTNSADGSAYINNEIHIDLQQALDKLSAVQREIIIAKFIFSKSDKEITAELKISRQTVYKNKIKALDILRQELSK